MSELRLCTGCRNLTKYTNGQFVCEIFEIRTLASVNPNTGKCRCYNYKTVDCSCCEKPIDVDSELWGYDNKTRSQVLCEECIKMDTIPNRRN